jgi:hypothetical protein
VEAGEIDRLQIALESVLFEKLSLRAGYSKDLADPLLGGLAGLNLGLGFSIGRYRIDYAFQPFGDLGVAQRVGIEWTLPPAPQLDERADPSEAAPKQHSESRAITTTSLVQGGASAGISASATLSSTVPDTLTNAASTAMPPAALPLSTTPLAADSAATAGPTPQPTVAPVPAEGNQGKAYKVVFGEDDMDPQEAALRSSLQEKPGSWVAWRLLADYLFTHKRKAEAIEAYAKTLELHDDPTLRAWFDTYKGH